MSLLNCCYKCTNTDIPTNLLVKELVFNYLGDIDVDSHLTDTIIKMAEDATGRANEAADIVENIVAGKIRAQDVSTEDGSTQAAKNTEFRNELDLIPFEDGALADSFITVTENGVGTIARTQGSKNKDTVSPFDFGAIGDGTEHLLSSKFTTLEEAQESYPTAQSLDDCIDLVALESFFKYCKTYSGFLANISIDAYINRPLQIAGNFNTKTFVGHLKLRNSSKTEDISHLFSVNSQDLTFKGTIELNGIANNKVKDMKQHVGLVVGDGGGDGSAGRVSFDKVICFNFRDAGLALINDSIFPTFNYVYAGRIGARGTATSTNSHLATIQERVDDKIFSYEQYSRLKVDSLPPAKSISGLQRNVMVVHDGEIYVVKSIDYEASTINVYPCLNFNSEVTNIHYIYGAAVSWVGNNSGVGNFGMIQAILCGIGYGAYSLYGATIGQLCTEYCGVGIDFIKKSADNSIAHTLNTAYFESNTCNIANQWVNQSSRNGLNILNTVGFDWSKVVDFFEFRVSAYDAASGGRRRRKRMSTCAISYHGKMYEAQSYLNTAGLDSNQPFIRLPPSDTITLSANHNLCARMDINSKILLLDARNTATTIHTPAGFKARSYVVPARTSPTLIYASIDSTSNVLDSRSVTLSWNKSGTFTTQEVDITDLAAGGKVVLDVLLEGAVVGDNTLASLNKYHEDLDIRATVASAGTVKVTIVNTGLADITLTDSSIKVQLA